MPDIIVNKTINASVAQVWESWDAFGDIERFNPNLKASRLINSSATTGKGAMRQCDLADGKNFIRERIVEYVPEKRMVIDIFEGTMPLKSAVVTFTLMAKGPESTNVSLRMDFVPKFGLLGRMMVPMMKPQFRKMFDRLLSANAAFVERGEEVNMAA